MQRKQMEEQKEKEKEKRRKPEEKVKTVTASNYRTNRALGEIKADINL